MTSRAVEEDIEKGVAKGWFVNLGNYASDLAGVAVPFPFHYRRNALVIGGPVSRVEKRVDELGSLLLESVENFLAEHGE